MPKSSGHFKSRAFYNWVYSFFYGCFLSVIPPEYSRECLVKFIEKVDPWISVGRILIGDIRNVVDNILQIRHFCGTVDIAVLSFRKFHISNQQVLFRRA